ncbi:MAG: TonB family protein [Bradymonadia bacterium]
MADSRDKKILRIGLIQNGKIVEERLLRRRETVTIGQSPRNTFVISSVAGLPKSYSLFEVKTSSYHLNFKAGMNGKVSFGDSVYDFKTLREQKRARKRGEGYVVELSDQSRGKVVFGDVVILFQFVTPPPPPSKLQLPASLKGGIAQRLDWPYVTALMASFALQVFSLAYIVNQDYPEPPRSFESLPDRFIQMISKPKPKLPEPKPEKDDKDKEKDKDEKSKVKKPKVKKTQVVVKKAPEEKPKENPEQTARRKAKELRKMQKEVSNKTILKFIGVKDGGTGSVLDTLTDGAPDTKMEDAFSGNGGVMEATRKGMGRDRRIGKTTGKVSGISSKDLKGKRSAVAGGKKGKETKIRGKIKVKSPSPAIGTGILSASSISSVVRRRAGAVRSCYEKQLKKNPNLNGSVKVRITILESGRVGSAKIAGNSTGDSAVASCITSRVKRWRFPKPDGGSVTVTVPFVLSKAN